jgi:hypothetical protein
LLEPAPSAGFVLLSRYVDTLAQIHSLPIAPLELRTASGDVIDMSRAQLLAHGGHSLVLLPSPDAQYVVKISHIDLNQREVRIHDELDGCSVHLRPMLAGPGRCGTVHGAGPGLSFVALQGVGDPFLAEHVQTDASLASLWQQASSAVAAMHAKHVLHRDIKPSNFIIVHGALLLNDFDAAWSQQSDTDAQLQQLHVGTDAYRSPKLAGKWRERDDWLALALSFLSLRLSFPFSNKGAVLEQALNHAWVPDDMKKTIRKGFK